MNTIKTSEYVLFGHPDKLADSISDAILDKVLEQDPYGHVAVETLVTGNTVVLAGEISAAGANLDLEEIARQTIAEAGYIRADLGFSAFTCKVINLVQKQSSELARLQDGEAVAGDQGIMTGFATCESPDYLPLQHSVAKRALDAFWGTVISFHIPEIFTDAKSIATVSFQDEKLPLLLDLKISFHNHLPEPEKYYELLSLYTINMLRDYYRNFLEIPDNFKVSFNPGGPFTIGGPTGDTGLTGRKIAVDQYGDEVPVGGGAFSGKDPSKVDRSAAYYARYVAKNLVAAGLCEKALVRVSYMIGQKEPLTVSLNTFGTNTTSLSDDDLLKLLLDKKIFDFKVKSIIDGLDLRKPIYKPAGQVGPFGSSSEPHTSIIKGQEVKHFLFPWEQLDLIKRIQAVVPED